MKLKKIASLMLAGIMAVSMLAGCKDGSANNGNAGSSSSEVPTVGGYTASLYVLLNANSKDVMDCAESDILKVAIDSSAKSADLNSLSYKNAITAFTTQTASNTASKVVASNLDGKWIVKGAANKTIGLVSTDLVYKDGETHVYVMLAPTSMTTGQVDRAVAAEVNGLLSGVNPNGITTTQTYTMSAERVLIGSSDSGFYLIAVAIGMKDAAK